MNQPLNMKNMKNLVWIFLLMTVCSNAQPLINYNPTPYAVCDTDQNGFSNFDLLTKNAEILNGESPVQYELTYHETTSDAFSDVNSINTGVPYTNINPFSQTLWVRVEEISDPTNFVTTTLSLLVNAAPVVGPIPNLSVYENPFDGAAVFDLTSHENVITNGVAGLTVVFYHTQVDAEIQANAIPFANTYNGVDQEVIWVNVQNTATSCFTVSSFTLRVFDSSTILFFLMRI